MKFVVHNPAQLWQATSRPGCLHQAALAPIVLVLFHLSVPVAHGQIVDIRPFLEQCPTNDPAYGQIRMDFRVLRDGAPVGALACAAPVSALPVAQYTDELIVVQGLRVLYYMDRGRSGHLPWTSGTIYQWMKTTIRGFNISTTATNSSCCDLIGGEYYVVIADQDDGNRDFDRRWRGISGNISLYAHEARHRDGFAHVSGCPVGSGCDVEYSESNLSSYAIQWWLNASWLSGHLYVGFACTDAATTSEIANWHLSAANGSRGRFTRNPPPVLNLPAQPGGGCRPAVPNTPSNLRIVQ